jgi:hypothetical protein
MLVNGGGDVNLRIGDKWDGEWVSKDSIKPRGIFPVPLVGGKVGVFAKGWLDNGVVRVVVELDDIGPVVIGKVGDFREFLGVMVKIAKYEDGVFAE